MTDRFESNFDDEAIPEVLSFNEGVQQAIARIEDILTRQAVAIVDIHGSGINVGKSYLMSQLMSKFLGTRLPVIHGLVDNVGKLYQNINYSAAVNGQTGGIIFLENTGLDAAIPPEYIKIFKDKNNEAVGALLKEIGIESGKIDLWISIYRTGRPFRKLKSENARPVGDIIICNEQARDK